MSESTRRVTDAASLMLAAHQGVAEIEVQGVIVDLKSITLPAQTSLRGIDANAELHFKPGQPGLLLTANQKVSDIRLVADETQVALGLADAADDLGTLSISNITAIGRVHLEGARATQGHLKLDNIHVDRADARMAAHRPAGFGVEVLLGGISIYNSSKSSESQWTLEARNLSGGSRHHPLRGSGVFVFGGSYIPVDADPSIAPAPTQAGGSIALQILTTGEIHVDGGIPHGTGNLITGGVFVGSGVHAREVINTGPATTYGSNDMVLDNWGRVDAWTTHGDVTSFGNSGIGFVNFGDIDILKIGAPIETRGLGARGFNLYDGTLRHAEFAAITTYGDGAIGIQVSKPFGSLLVHGNVLTKGGQGDSLVRGKVVHLKAFAFSIKPGARGDKITVRGDVTAENEAISDWDFEAAPEVITSIEVAGQPLR